MYKLICPCDTCDAPTDCIYDWVDCPYSYHVNEPDDESDEEPWRECGFDPH